MSDCGLLDRFVVGSFATSVPILVEGWHFLSLERGTLAVLWIVCGASVVVGVMRGPLVRFFLIGAAGHLLSVYCALICVLLP